MARQIHTLPLGPRRLEVQLEPTGRSTTAVLRVDGQEVGTATGWPVVRIAVREPGLVDSAQAAVAVTAFRPGRGSVRLVVRDDEAGVRRPERIDFEPPKDTWAHRKYVWARAHPRLYAARHVVVATAQVVAGLVAARIALGFVLRLDLGWLPDWRLPRIPRPQLPDLPWPDLPWPDLSWPDVSLPDWALPVWLQQVLATRKYWFPILVAVAVAVAEVRRRRRREAAQDSRESAVLPDGSQDGTQDGRMSPWPAPSTPSDTRSAGSSSSTPP